MDLGQGITILANLGVIAGIAFLGLELRQNNSLLEAEAGHNLLQNRLATRNQILENTEIAELLVKLASGDCTVAVDMVPAQLTARSVGDLESFVSGRLGDQTETALLGVPVERFSARRCQFPNESVRQFPSVRFAPSGCRHGRSRPVIVGLTAMTLIEVNEDLKL